MTGTKIGLVYNKQTGIVRRTILSSNPAEDQMLERGWPYLQSDENIDVISRSEVNRPTAAVVCARVNELKGKNLRVAPRCVILDSSNYVVDVIMADPDTYVVAGVTPEITRNMNALKAVTLSTQTPFDLVPTGPFRVRLHAQADIGDKIVAGILERKPEFHRNIT